MKHFVLLVIMAVLGTAICVAFSYTLDQFVPKGPACTKASK